MNKPSEPVVRSYFKGEYKGEKKRPVREGSDLLAKAPSLYCDTLLYPDGRREKEVVAE